MIIETLAALLVVNTWNAMTKDDQPASDRHSADDPPFDPNGSYGSGCSSSDTGGDRQTSLSDWM